MKRMFLVTTALPFVLGTTVGEAQADRHFGITVGHPSAVGLLWQAGNHLALRSDLAFSRSTSGVPSVTSWSVTSGLSALLVVAKLDSLRAYFVPRLSYRFIGSTGSPWSKSYNLDGGFGLQHDLARRLTVFAEAGLRYASAPQRVIEPNGEVLTVGHSSTLGTMAGVGLMLLFR